MLNAMLADVHIDVTSGLSDSVGVALGHQRFPTKRQRVPVRKKIPLHIENFEVRLSSVVSRRDVEECVGDRTTNRGFVELKLLEKFTSSSFAAPRACEAIVALAWQKTSCQQTLAQLVAEEELGTFLASQGRPAHPGSLAAPGA